jgi:hypothetical protein
VFNCQLTQSSFVCMASNVFFIVLCIKLGFLILLISHYICRHPLDFIGIHLFRYAHGGEKITSHDVV